MSKSILFSTDIAINLAIDQIKFSMEQLTKFERDEIELHNHIVNKEFKLIHERFIKLALFLGSDENFNLNFSKDIKDTFNEHGILIDEKEMPNGIQYSLYLKDDMNPIKFVLNIDGRNFTNEELTAIKKIYKFNNRIK